MKCKNSNDLSQLNNFKLKVFIYGKPKTGKRTFASTFPKPYVIDTDKGMLSLRHLNIPYYTFEDEQTAIMQANAITQCAKDLATNTECESIIFSSLTTISEIFLNSIQLLNGRIGKTPQYDPEWAQLKTKLNTLLEIGINSEKHVCFIAHEKIDKCEKTGRVSIAPALIGQLAHTIGLRFDELYHAETFAADQKYQYRILIKELGLYNAGSRLLNRVTKELYHVPNFSSIMTTAGIKF